MPSSSRIRYACSLLLHRESTGQVYLARRAPELRFFGGFWAFAGGAVDATDAALPSTATEDAAFVASAAREALEELGLDLTVEDHPGLVSDELRRAVLADGAAYGRWLQEYGRTVDASRLRPFLRLLTPPFSPIRFDTIFYALEPDREPIIWPGELVDGRWDTPANWLRQWEQGELLIAPPVLLILRCLEEHGLTAAQPYFDELARGFDEGRIHPIFYNPAVQLMPLLTPTLPPATHTNAYIVGRDPAYLIDPATPHADVRERLAQAIDEAREQGRRLEAIVLTHHHPDHVGAVEFARERFGLPVWAHPVTADLLRGSIHVDRFLEDGDRLSLGTSPRGNPWELEVIFTPGHAAGHLCFYEAEYGSLVVGDMISTLSSILIHPDDGNMEQYMASLERLAQIPSRMVFPAHGPATNTGARALADQLAHRRSRELQVLAAMQAGSSTASAIAERVYPDLPDAVRPYAVLSVRSIVDMLLRQQRAQTGPSGLRAV